MVPFRRVLPLLVALLALLSPTLAPPPTEAAVTRSRVVQAAVATQALPAYTLYPPSNAAERGPLQVLVALHGMGGDGPSISAPLRDYAEQNGWLMVAPSFGYGDWTNPEQVRLDDAAFLPQLKTLIDSLPARSGLALKPRVLLYGFSRGGQTAHRFAEFYPQSVLGVASFSCGSYTLPYTAGTTSSGQALSLAFPYGVADLQRYTGRPFNLDAFRQISFLIGVGAEDKNPNDVPRQWDPYIGTNRLDRARNYHQALTTVGAPSQLAEFPGGIHYESDEMRARAMGFLASLGQ